MRGLIFDFDGLILDTEMPDYVSWQGVYREHGAELPLEGWASIVGGKAESDFDPYDHLEKLTNKKIDREAIWIKRRKDYLENLESQPILPGVSEYLRDARGMGLKIGIASSSPENWVVGHLTRLGLIEKFDVVCTADDVAESDLRPPVVGWRTGGPLPAVHQATRRGAVPAACVRACQETESGFLFQEALDNDDIIV